MRTTKDYYQDEETLKSILDGVESPGLRVWKAQLKTGVFKQNTKKINNINKLREFLRGEVVKVFVSVSKFLNPHKVFGKHPKGPRYKIADSLFLKSDLLFDLDHEDLEVAHRDGLRIIKFMRKQKDYKLINIRYSGTKGFHLLYRDNKPIQEPHPLKRLQRTEARRRRLVKKLPTMETIDELHKNIICDQFRVHTALNTVKGKTGHKVVEISEDDFIRQPTSYIYKHYIHRAVRPTRSMIKDENLILTSTKGKERPALISYPYYYHFVTNRVRGVKDGYIVVLKYPQKKIVKPLIRKVIEKYNQTDFMRLDYKDVQMWISLKVVSRTRLEKILRFAKPMNLCSSLFYKHTWIPITEAVDSKGSLVWVRPKLKEIILVNKKATYSKPHANLMNLKFEKTAGYEENKICKAIITEK
jgi:hypothetical protein